MGGEVTSYLLQVISYELQVMSYELQVTRYQALAQAVTLARVPMLGPTQQTADHFGAGQRAGYAQESLEMENPHMKLYFGTYEQHIS